MQAANRVAVGAGRLAREDRDAIVTRWQRTADPAGATRPRAARATLGDLARIGIGVHRVPKKATPAQEPA